MRGTLSRTPSHRSAVFACALCVALPGLGLLGGHALAQPQPPTPVPASTSNAAPTIESKPNVQPKRKGKAIPTPSAKRRPRASTFAMNPNAKWACDKPTVTQGPTWRGAKNLTFEFDIRNDGTEDLRIRAKGG